MNKKYLTKEQQQLIRGENNCREQLRSKGYRVLGKSIFCGHKSVEEFPRGPRYYADKLVKLGYEIQERETENVN